MGQVVPPAAPGKWRITAVQAAVAAYVEAEAAESDGDDGRATRCNGVAGVLLGVATVEILALPQIEFEKFRAFLAMLAGGDLRSAKAWRKALAMVDGYAGTEKW